MRVGFVVDITKNYKEEIRRAKELGFDLGQLVIWDMDFYTKENLEGLKKTLQEEKFEVMSMWCGWTGPVKWGYPDMYRTLGLVPDWMRQKRVEDLRKGAKFAYDLGIDTVVTHVGYTPDDPFDPRRMAMVQVLREFCAELKERGQRLAFETGEEIPLTLSIMIGEIGLDNVGVNFDPANLLCGGRANPNDAMEHLAPRIFGMHAKDGVAPKFGDIKGRQVQIGTGEVDFERLILQLKENGYEGDIAIEHEIAGVSASDRDKGIKEAKKYIEEIVGRIF